MRHAACGSLIFQVDFDPSSWRETFSN